MRAHGVPNFPDPNSQPGILKGHFGFTADSGIDPDTPQFKAAYLYCGARYLGLHRPSPAEMAQSNAEAVKFSACMRSHGATDFPDPDGQGAIRVPSDTYMDSPKAQQAERACKSLETGKKFVLSIPIPVR